MKVSVHAYLEIVRDGYAKSRFLRGHGCFRTSADIHSTIHLLFRMWKDHCRAQNDRARLDYLAKLEALYNREAGGGLALSILRAHHYLTVSSDRESKKTLTELYMQLRDSGLLTKIDFCRALLAANELRAERSNERKNDRLTEEGNLRAELTIYGVLMQLLGKKPEYTAEQLRKRFDPKGSGDDRNWRKKLHDCEVQFIPGKPGRPKNRVA